MLHAVKYLLIAMQFPEVHKKELYDDDVEFVCLKAGDLLSRPELNYQTVKNFLLTIHS